MPEYKITVPVICGDMERQGGRKANSLTDVVAGKDVGTLILGATV